MIRPTVLAALLLLPIVLLSQRLSFEQLVEKEIYNNFRFQNADSSGVFYTLIAFRKKRNSFEIFNNNIPQTYNMRVRQIFERIPKEIYSLQKKKLVVVPVIFIPHSEVTPDFALIQIRMLIQLSQDMRKYKKNSVEPIIIMGKFTTRKE